MIICNLKEIMIKNKEYDLHKLARELEISYDTLHHLAENQWHQLRREHLDALCRYFDCKVGDLLEFRFSPGSELPA